MKKPLSSLKDAQDRAALLILETVRLAAMPDLPARSVSAEVEPWEPLPAFGEWMPDFRVRVALKLRKSDSAETREARGKLLAQAVGSKGLQSQAMNQADKPELALALILTSRASEPEVEYRRIVVSIRLQMPAARLKL